MRQGLLRDLALRERRSTWRRSVTAGQRACGPSDWVAGYVVKRPARLRVAKSHVGESMSNTILPGAILTVDLGPVGEVTPGGIYIVQDENAGVMVKRVYPLSEEGSSLCMNDNRAFLPFRIREDEGGGLLGRVLRWEQGEENGPTV